MGSRIAASHSEHSNANWHTCLACFKAFEQAYERAHTAAKEGTKMMAKNHTCDVLRPNMTVPYSDGPCEACSAERQGDGDYAATFGMPETIEAICLNCKHPFNRHEGWNQHGSSLRCPVIMADTLVGFSDKTRWGFGGTQPKYSITSELDADEWDAEFRKRLTKI